jgi:hypothetical protein
MPQRESDSSRKCHHYSDTLLVDNHPELEAVVNDVALKQPTTASLEKVQANLQERARAIIEAKPELEGYFED